MLLKAVLLIYVLWLDIHGIQILDGFLGLWSHVIDSHFGTLEGRYVMLSWEHKQEFSTSRSHLNKCVLKRTSEEKKLFL